MSQNDSPTVRRASLLDLALTAAGGDPAREQRVRDAGRLDPAHRMQVLADQLHWHLDAQARGEPSPFDGGYPVIAADTLQHMAAHRDTLREAFEAAAAFYDHTKAQVERVHDAMSKKNADKHPDMDAHGNEHPLERGGYEANDDAQRSAAESDVNALKSGHATQAQAEALAKTDVAEAAHPEGEQAEKEGRAVPQDDDGDDKKKAPKAKK